MTAARFIAITGAAALVLLQSPVQAAPANYDFPPSLFQAAVACPGSERKASVLSGFEVRWFSKHWRAAGEPSIYSASKAVATPGTATYRFTWLRSFHHPIMVRIETDRAGEMELFAEELSGAGGYEPGGIKRRLHRRLSPAEKAMVHAIFSQPDVFAGPGSECSSGMDGAQWIVEARDGGDYRFINAWTPEAGPVRDLGLALLRLTAWKIDPVY